MRIVIDLQAAQTPDSRHRGIGRYTAALTTALIKRCQQDELILSLNARHLDAAIDLKKHFSGELQPSAFFSYHYPLLKPHYTKPIAAELITHAYAKLFPDVLHLSSIFEGQMTDAEMPQKIARIPHCVTVITLYDLIPLIFSSIYLQNKNTKAWYYQKLSLLKQADIILAISEATRQDAINYLSIPESQVVNISGAVNAHFRPLALSAEEKQWFLNRYQLHSRFVLYTGGIDYRKNIHKLIEAYAGLPSTVRKGLQLVIVCAATPEVQEELQKYAQKCHLDPQALKLTGFVPDEDLVYFYNLCTAFIFPSLYEGFGLPIVEAMACGAPVICSNVSSMPEIIGRQDAQFDPNDVASITQMLHKVLTQEDFRKELCQFGLIQSKKFSWENSAKLTFDAYQEAHQKKQPSNAIYIAGFLPRRKLAWFTPLPDQRSGIANYNAELLPELSKYFDIDLYSDNLAVTDPWLSNNFTIYDWHEFPKRHKDYDAIVYHFGNSNFHSYMYDLLQLYPGIVVLHDFFLSRLIFHLQRNEGYKDLLKKEMQYSHGEKASLMLTANDIEAMDQYPCNYRVLKNALGVIIHSPYSAVLAQQFYAKKILPPFRYIPLTRRCTHLNEDINSIRKKYGFSSDDYLICSFGFLANTKLNEKLIEAFTQSLLAKNKKVKLLFVGELNAYDDYGKRILEQIRRTACADRIIITGYQEMTAYQDYLAITDLAVQLRTNTRGESAGTVLDCLAHGTPIILNAYATFNDYPDDILYKIPADAPIEPLTKALENLYQDKTLSATLSEKAKLYIKNRHHPAKVATEYAVILNEFIERTKAASHETLIKNLAEKMAAFPIVENDLIQIAQHVIGNVTDQGELVV